MQMDYQCLPCLVSQVVRVAEMTNAPRREELFRRVFAYLAQLDMRRTNPEIIGDTFRMLKEHIGNDDPYKETRDYYNQLFLGLLERFASEINAAPDPFEEAVKYAIVGNVVDFGPAHGCTEAEVMARFEGAHNLTLTVNHTARLQDDLAAASSLLYLGDNCGEICLDRLLLEQIHTRYPQLRLYFGVRGAAVVNDSIEADAYAVGIHRYATVVSNGNDSLGTVLHRASPAFQHIYREADVVISKGQANYESLSEEVDKNIYFMLTTKCPVIAKSVGVPEKSLVCLNRRSQ